MRCSFCDMREADAGSLQCEHAFCHDCFSRFIHGTVDELLHYLRCCICGQMTILTTETKTEKVERRFGRDLLPRLYTPVGIAHRLDGSYVTADTKVKRIYVFDRHGRKRRDFPYIHKYEPMQGIVVNLSDEIVIPCMDGDRCLLAYFTPDGSYLSSTYLPEGSDIKGLAVNSSNQVIASDAQHHCVHVVHERRRLVRSIPVPCAPGEKLEPSPCGITCDQRGRILLTDTANHSIKVLDAEGSLLRHFGSRGSRPGQFDVPTGLCVDSRGRILVTDENNHRVQIFDWEGRFLHFIVRYNQGDDVYMTPVDLLPLPNNMAAILLRGDRDAKAAEIRIYSCQQIK